MDKQRRSTLNIRWLLGLLVPLLIWGGALHAENEKGVLIIDLEGPINPGTAMYTTRGIDIAKEQSMALIVLRLDTPGGLASSMRTIVKAILNSPIPVAVYVGPTGAGAASAGVMITVAGHIAAMALRRDAGPRLETAGVTKGDAKGEDCHPGMA